MPAPGLRLDFPGNLQVASLATTLFQGDNDRAALDLALHVAVLLEHARINPRLAVADRLAGSFQLGGAGGMVLLQQGDMRFEGMNFPGGALAQLFQLQTFLVDLLKEQQFLILKLGDFLFQVGDFLFEGSVFLVLFDLHLLGLVLDNGGLRMGHLALEIQTAQIQGLNGLLPGGQFLPEPANGCLLGGDFAGNRFQLVPDPVATGITVLQDEQLLQPFGNHAPLDAADFPVGNAKLPGKRGFLPLRCGSRLPHHHRMIGLNEAHAGPADDAPSLHNSGELVERVFCADGLLCSRLGLDHRSQQEEMARQTHDNLAADDPLFFEAGTGVGKSLAYLIPGIILAVGRDRPLVVSTHTIALQEQIENKDLPLCRELFKSDPDLAPFAGFRHAVLLGRANYLCGARLAQAMRTRTELFPSEQQKELTRIGEWAATTGTGLLQELDPQPLPEVWDWVHADGHACNNRNCTPQTCFFRRAREAVRRANVVVVNHSLLFSLLAAGHFPQGKAQGILFPRDFMVIDEAHTLPAVATEYFGLRLSALGLRRTLMKLYHRRKPKASGLLVRQGNPGLRNQVMALTEGAEHYFQAIRENYLSRGTTLRLQQPDWHPNDLDLPLRDLVQGLRNLENRLEEGAERDELEGLRRSLDSYREGIRQVICIADPEAVYWLEASGKNKQQVHLRSAPLDVSGPLRERLFERDTGLLLTSATLAEGPTMDSFKHKVGAPEADSRQVLSPFDYPLQMEILIHREAPEPSGDDRRLNHAFLAGELERLCTELDGGTLALFTSYHDLLAVHRILEPRFNEIDRPLLCQGTGISRSRLLEMMQSEGNALLLGTDSFWTGVDVPGQSLSQVIVTRLPFENPSHPVAEARSERCRMEGRSPFAELVLPAALVKFRQGIGRLIRKQTDEGRLVILDSRILTKPYGRLFLEVLPHDQIQFIR